MHNADESTEINILPDGSGFALANIPLPKDHWIYGDPSMEIHDEHGSYEPPPMPMRMGTDNPDRVQMIEALRKAGRYAVRASTSKGAIQDFDPDALIQNLIIGMLGYFTPSGLSQEDWENPKD